MRWMHYSNARTKYVLHVKQSVLLVGSRIKSGREFQAIGPATENARRPSVLRRTNIYLDTVHVYINAKLKVTAQSLQSQNDNLRY